MNYFNEMFNRPNFFRLKCNDTTRKDKSGHHSHPNNTELDVPNFQM